MIAAEDTALLLLAAGESRRYGAGPSKLDASVRGLPLGLHAARAVAVLPFARRIAVTARSAIDYAAEGFLVIPNDDPVGDMASSLRLAMAAAGNAAAVLVLLADMPNITAAHVERLLAAGDGPRTIVASADGGAARPPALFGQAWFDALSALYGDHGARDLIRSGKLVHARVGELADVDTRDDLAAL
jgi:molybdenum cofactor cytidylyltransferase